MDRSKKRIMLDYKEILNDPVENIYYIHDEHNIYKGYGLIIGPTDTPYENGFYFYEFLFPENYPFSPPKVKMINYDGKTRFNPNMYINGHICLSILNTWEGEKWSSCQSIKSILNTLMITLNDTPLLNEPGITIQHQDFNSYNKIIEYKNIEINILKYLEKSQLPYAFHLFYPILVEKFKNNYETIINKCKQNEINKGIITINIYNNMSANIDYSNLIIKLNNIYNNLKIDLK